MQAQVTRPASRHALRIALMCAAAALLAACGDVPVASTSGGGNGMYSGALDGAKPAEEHRRAFTGWNSNAVGVNVISGTGRPQLR